MTSPTPATEANDRYLLAQVRELFGRVVYSHKKHEKQADICFRRHRYQQAVLIALTAISSGTFLVSVIGLVGRPEMASLVTSFIALLVTAASLGTKTFKFDEEAQAHRDIAAQLWNVRESYLSLIADLMSSATSAQDGRSRRDELQQATVAVYAEAPRTSSAAYRKAKKGLKEDEEMTFTAAEIDLFLPQALRLGSSGSQR